MVSLLPANRTPFEEALEAAFTPDLALCADPIRQLRRHPNEQVVPWLIWEYGLSEIAPYIDDPYRLIEEGILWQRERGTPAALCRALEWVSQTGCIEQEEGVHWAEIQLALQAQPDERTLQAVRKLTRLSIPARTRLARIHDGNWDVRRMVLDSAALDETLLSDWSGVVIDNVVHSFGKCMTAGFVLPALRLHTKTHDIYTSHARLQDRVLLDYVVFGERPVLNHPVVIGAMQSSGVRREGAMPRLTVHGFSLDGLVLSESALDTHFIDPRIFEPADTMPLDDWALDQKPAGGHYRLVDQFHGRTIQVAVQWEKQRTSTTSVSSTHLIAHPRTTPWPVLDDAPAPMQSTGTLKSEQGLSAARTGRSWQTGWTGGWDSTTLIGAVFSDAEMGYVTRPQAQLSGIGQTEHTDAIELSVAADDTHTDEITVAVSRISRTWQTAWAGSWLTETTTGEHYVSAD